jgi:hypothetical protein
MLGAMDAVPLPPADTATSDLAIAPHGPPCPGCSRPRTEADARGIAWSSRHAPDGVRFVCPDCTRTELDQIEAGLVTRTATPRAARRSPAA